MSMLRLLLKTVDETRFVKSYHKLKYRFNQHLFPAIKWR